MTHDQGLKPNEVLEALMKATIEAGDVRAFLKGLGSSKAEQVVLKTTLMQDLDEIERLCGAGFWQAYEHEQGRQSKFPEQPLAEEIQRLIDSVLEVLPRCRDENVIERSKRILGMGSMYVMLEHWVDIPGSPQAYKLMDAYRRITDPTIPGGQTC